MADFGKAFSYLSDLEGGYVNDPADRGGPTRYGISLRFYKETVDQYASEEDIRDLSLERAKRLYWIHFWDKIDLVRLDSQPVANRVFALAVHSGLKPAIRVLQRAVNQSGYNLEEDGVLGPKTVNATNSVSPRQLLPDLRHETWKLYREIMVRRPVLEKFLLGWRRRALL